MCLNNENCYSFIFQENNQKCRLLNIMRNSFTASILVIVDTHTNYYELACQRFSSLNNGFIFVFE